VENSEDVLNDPRDRRLTNAGFKYDKRVNVWFNAAAERAISGETVVRNTDEWIAGWLVAWPASPRPS
jgi:hypothetical protein